MPHSSLGLCTDSRYDYVSLFTSPLLLMGHQGWRKGTGPESPPREELIRAH